MSDSKGPPPAVALAADGSSVRIGPYSYPCDGLLTPNLKGWSHLTLDQPTFDLLLFVATAVDVGAPCLLEGPTAASKTSIVAFHAALTRHPLVRVNLHGHSTADDLLGRFVPAGGWKVTPRELLTHRSILDEQLVRWLESKPDSHSPLTPLESMLAAGGIDAVPPQWKYEEGPIPLAMRHGHRVVIDEMNLTDAQVLESLNSVLEEEPALFLPAQGMRFGPGGTPVHKDFRIFATMNPAGYAGRMRFSPAFINRWRLTKTAPVPTEAEFRQMLFCGVFGEHPRVIHEGREYLGITPALSEEPPYARLGRVPGMREVLERIATFHAQVVSASEQKSEQKLGLGSGRRDKYIYTRRDLFTLLALLQRYLEGSDLRQSLVRATEDVYLARLDSAEDRQNVSQFLRAQGIERQHWTLPSAQKTPEAESGPSAYPPARAVKDSLVEVAAAVALLAGDKKKTVHSAKIVRKAASKPLRKWALSAGFTLRGTHPP